MEKGEVVVLVAGTFDGLHAGHLHLFEFAEREGAKLAKALGKKGAKLRVIVARDANVLRIKGRRPLHSEKERVQLVSSLRPVDGVVLGHPYDLFASVRKINPDLIVLGFDQTHVPEAQLRKMGYGRIVRCPAFERKTHSSSRLRNIHFEKDV
ncbi:adenylyltransferase/cytidyltransferase family protein [Candidatus Micrarchaeota archaeon]|nr:adenylyltransferase/cytidyltransferase family protein [Candidatus Micrarchaeota archaeon]